METARRHIAEIASRIMYVKGKIVLGA